VSGILDIMNKLDPELFEHLEKTRDLAFSEGVIPLKFKILIALALDASHGATEGVKTLAELALQAGATKEEIAETLRVALYVSGAGSIYTAAKALKDII